MMAMDGLRAVDSVMTLVRRIAMAGGLLAAFGLVQFLTGQSWLGWLSFVPGVTIDSSGLIVRGMFTRASGTSIHPLEHATALCAALPLTIAVALHPLRARRDGLLGVVSALLIAVGSLLAVSRSAIIGFGIAVIATLPALPLRLRRSVIAACAVIVVGAVVAVPGLLGTMVDLFSPSGDASTKSRTDALARVPEFVASSPVYGIGFGTFLPRYYILDDAWLLMLIELGVVGLLAFASLFLTSVSSAVRASLTTTDSRLRFVGLALAASVTAVAVVFVFFDGLSFPIAAGMAFLLCGMCSSVRAVALDTLGVADRE